MKRRSAIDWPAVAERIRAALPIERLHPAVRQWIDGGARSRKKWHVALSGGADSVTLLLLLWAHWPKRRAGLCALHFDHCLRGAAVANADRDFCRRLCAGLKVKLQVGRLKRPAPIRRLAGAPPPISEAQARAERMEFLHRHAAILWLGHNQDDVAETMVMRLARGSGTGGMSAPRPVQSVADGRIHLRPLLAMKKAEIVRLLRTAGGDWREDATNSADWYFRNRVRRRVIPAWVRAAERDAIAGAARTRELLEEDDTALESWLDELGVLGRKRELRLEPLAGKPKAIVRRAVHRWLIVQRATIHVSRQAVDALVAAVSIAKPTRHSLGHEQFAVIRDGCLKFENRKSRSKF